MVLPDHRPCDRNVDRRSDSAGVWNSRLRRACKYRRERPGGQRDDDQQIDDNRQDQQTSHTREASDMDPRLCQCSAMTPDG